jgi:hypothetical protein
MSEQTQAGKSKQIERVIRQYRRLAIAQADLLDAYRFASHVLGPWRAAVAGAATSGSPATAARSPVCESPNWDRPKLYERKTKRRGSAYSSSSAAASVSAAKASE